MKFQQKISFAPNNDIIVFDTLLRHARYHYAIGNFIFLFWQFMLEF